MADKDDDAATRRRIKKGAGADPRASGATRIAGSYNFKPKYAPDYPRVQLQSIAPKPTVTVAELDSAGLIAPRELPPADPGHAPRLPRTFRVLTWPNYARCLAEAPRAKNHDGQDRSAADFNFCVISIDRGWAVEATANQLMAESENAKSTGYHYALFTARHQLLAGTVVKHISLCRRLRLEEWRGTILKSYGVTLLRHFRIASSSRSTGGRGEASSLSLGIERVLDVIWVAESRCSDSGRWNR